MKQNYFFSSEKSDFEIKSVPGNKVHKIFIYKKITNFISSSHLLKKKIPLPDMQLFFSAPPQREKPYIWFLKISNTSRS